MKKMQILILILESKKQKKMLKINFKNKKVKNKKYNFDFYKKLFENTFFFAFCFKDQDQKMVKNVFF